MNGIRGGMIGLLAAVAVGVGAGMFAVRERAAARRTETKYAEVTQRQTGTAEEITRLERQLQEQTARGETLEAHNAALRDTLARGEKARKVAAEKAVPLTRKDVEERIKATRDLVRSGNPAEAFRELLWCLDVWLQQGDTATAPARRSQLMESFRELAEVYAPAREELVRRRDAVRSRILANAGGADFVAEYAGLLRTLNEQPAMLSLLDEVPRDDRRRTALAIYGSEQLIEAKRYAEAMEGRPLSSLFSGFEAKSRMGSLTRPGAEGGASFLATSTARDIELLAGSGDIANARELANRLLAIDSSESTKALIQKHAERAGQPDLILTAKP